MEPAEHRARQAASDQWQRNPAGTLNVAAERASAAFYEEMAADRYSAHPWIPTVVREFGPSGRVLEIGCGAGQDNQLLGRTATAIGIDLAHEGAKLTDTLRRRDARRGGALVADRERMPFREGSFDAVYSLGVIHHTDHPDRIAAEMLRVLRPGGRFLVGLYYRWSLFAGLKVFEWIRSGRREPWREHLALLEAGAGDLPVRPTVRLYTRRGVHRLFREFDDVHTTIRHFGLGDPRIEDRISGRWRDRMARVAGWYVLASGTRPC